MTSHDTTIDKWIEVSNAHDTDGYVSFFTPDARIDDPSVGEVFDGEEGLRRYFDTYVVGYNTQTRIVSVTPVDDHVHVVVEFTGDFPGSPLGGYFDMTFAGEKISFILADLIH